MNKNSQTSFVKKKCQTSFVKKRKELANLQEDVHDHMRKLNILRIHYTDWFDRRRQTFLDAVQLFQFIVSRRPTNCADNICNFRKDCELANKFTKTGDRCASIMWEYLQFWDRLLVLHRQGQLLYQTICVYCKSVSEMREPRLNQLVDELQTRLNTEMDENFAYTTILHTSDDLFTYRAAQYDNTVHGLLSFIPHLLKKSIQVCSLYTKMSLEKE